MQQKTYLIIGGGAIGSAMAEVLAAEPHARVHIASSRKLSLKTKNIKQLTLGSWAEQTIEDLAASFKDTRFDGVFVALGVLHSDNFTPERMLKELNPKVMRQVFEVNTILPSVCGKLFAPLLKTETQSFFAALSARVGSISDNGLGGWYSYRMSKAALNMFIKTASIEVARKNKNAVVVGLHPGTVDSALSKPFQRNVPEGKLFTPEYSAQQLYSVLQNLTPNESGKCFDYAGEEVPA